MIPVMGDMDAEEMIDREFGDTNSVQSNQIDSNTSGNKYRTKQLIALQGQRSIQK